MMNRKIHHLVGLGVIASLVLLLAGGLAFSTSSWAKESTEPTEEETAELEEEAEKDSFKSRLLKGKNGYRLLPIPMLITEPAIGTGLGLALTLFHPVKTGKTGAAPRVGSLDTISDSGKTREAPPVSTAVLGAYTNNKTWAVGLGHVNNWRNDSIRYRGGLGFARVNSEVFIRDIPIGFTSEASLLYQGVRFRIRNSDFLLGGTFNYTSADNTFDVEPPQDAPPGSFANSFRNIGLAATALYDTLDSSSFPRKGRQVDLSLWRYDEAIGGDFDYWMTKIKFLSFHSLTDKATLGLRLSFWGVDGRPPFFAYPYVDLRGIPALRYQDKKTGLFEIEGRYRVRPRIEVSVFGGLGYVSDDVPLFTNPDNIYNFGVGGRYNIFESHNIWIGLDIARGPEDWHGYIQVGHQW